MTALKHLVNLILSEDKISISAVKAACTLTVNDKDEVLAVSRRTDPTKFGMPGGKVDPGEHPKVAAVRELKEETGLDGTDLELVFLEHDTNGLLVAVYTCNVSGTIKSSEEGVAKYVDKQVLLEGPFADYNRRLYDVMGW